MKKIPPALQICITLLFVVTLMSCAFHGMATVTDKNNNGATDSGTVNSKSDVSKPAETNPNETEPYDSESITSTYQIANTTGSDTSEYHETTAKETDDISSKSAPDTSVPPETAGEKASKESEPYNSDSTPPQTGAPDSSAPETIADETLTPETSFEEPEEAPIELTYIDGILIVNKTYPLPSSYNPGVNEEAKSALQLMFKDAKKDGLKLYVCSGFRSYETQSKLYKKYLESNPKEIVDKDTARPGHSEHQTGLAFDIIDTVDSFADTPEGKWLAKNCYKYGFIIRYPEGKESVTGYIYEPWHIRYLGVDVATSVFNSGMCLEEYLGITSEYQN